MNIYTIYHNYNVFKTCINANSFLRTYHKLREYFVKKPSDKPDRRGLLADFPKSKRKLFEGRADTSNNSRRYTNYNSMDKHEGTNKICLHHTPFVWLLYISCTQSNKLQITLNHRHSLSTSPQCTCIIVKASTIRNLMQLSISTL